MITCNLMGGLGNQIFEIFATISYALKSHNNFKFLALDKLGEGATTIRYTYWNSFFSNLKPFLIHNLPNLHNCIKENGFLYNELPVSKMINKDRSSFKNLNENFSTEWYKILKYFKLIFFKNYEGILRTLIWFKFLFNYFLVDYFLNLKKT